MLRLAEILLRDLEFHHLWSLLHVVEDGGVGFPGLEVERPVLALQHHVGAKQPVKFLKLRDCLLHTVFPFVTGTIDKRTPHHDAPIGSQGIGQHVGSVGMCATVVERTGLALGIGLHKETSEVGNEPVQFFGLVLPPLDDTFIERVGRLCGPQSLGRTEVDREVNLNAPRPQNVGYHPHGVEIRAGEHLR